MILTGWPAPAEKQGVSKASANPAIRRFFMATLLICNRPRGGLPMQQGTDRIVNCLVGNAQTTIKRRKTAAARSRGDAKQTAGGGAARVRRQGPCRRQGRRNRRACRRQQAAGL